MGGTRGKLGFPSHMEDFHSSMLGTAGFDINTDLYGVMDNALSSGGNPWGGTEAVSLTDPASDLADVKTRYDAIETSVDALDEEADWKSIVDTAVSKVDQDGVLNDVDLSPVVDAARTSANTAIGDAIDQALKTIDGDIVESVVDQFEKKSNKQKNKIVNRFNATMADVNAVQSSAYIFGMAIIEAEHLQRVDEFQSNVSLQLLQQNLQTFAQVYSEELQARLSAEIVNKTDRDQVLESATRIMTQMLSQNTQLEIRTSELLSDIKRIDILTTQEYELKDADLDYKFAKWDFEVHTMGVQAVGGIGQGSYTPPQPSKIGSAIGGALSGGMKGFQTAGTAGGVAGLVLGAGAGLAGG